jgi:dTDP-4-amino-4,6-dideoxygalactose transaminase
MIPFLDLKSQYRSIKGEIDAAVMRILESGQFVLGEDVMAFEKEFAVYCGDVRHGIAVNSGTSALHLALLAAGVGPGDAIPVHLQPAFAELEYVAGDFPYSEAIAAEELSLPMYAELSADKILQVAEAVSKGLAQCAGERAIAPL